MKGLLHSVSDHTLIVALRGVPLVHGLCFTTNLTRGTGEPVHPLLNIYPEWIWEWN